MVAPSFVVKGDALARTPKKARAVLSLSDKVERAVVIGVVAVIFGALPGTLVLQHTDTSIRVLMSLYLVVMLGRLGWWWGHWEPTSQDARPKR